MKEFKYIDVFGFKVFSDELENITPSNEKCVINTINANSYAVTKSDKMFKEALMNSDILIPDGFPVVVAAKWIHKASIKKIAGEDIFFHLCRIMEVNKGKVFFLGASDHTLEKIISRMKKEFPSVKVGIFSPPFKHEFSSDDNLEMHKAVNDFAPDVLFVGLTAPKQEKWVNLNKNFINAPIICSIGAVFDFYAGTVSRPSQFWIKLKLEWFIRLVKEPKRMWRRYLVNSPVFFLDLFKYIIRN